MPSGVKFVRLSVTTATGVPHFPQKSAPVSRSPPHFVQIIRDATSTCAVLVSSMGENAHVRSGRRDWRLKQIIQMCQLTAVQVSGTGHMCLNPRAGQLRRDLAGDVSSRNTPGADRSDHMHRHVKMETGRYLRLRYSRGPSPTRVLVLNMTRDPASDQETCQHTLPSREPLV